MEKQKYGIRNNEEEKRKRVIVAALLSTAVALYITIAPAMAMATNEITEEWNRTFGGAGSDYGYSVQQTTDGGYVLAGHTYSYGAGDADIWLIRTDSNGTEIWSRTFGGTEADLLDRGSVRQTSDGGYIITGYTYSYGAGEADAWLIKTDTNGNEQWNRTFGGEWLDWGHSVQQTSDGGYIIAGRKLPKAGAPADAWLIKTYSNGTEEWNRTFGTDACEYAASVQQTSDGGYIIAGRTSSYGAGLVDAWLIKTNSSGVEEWNRTFGGQYYDYGYSVEQTSDGGYIIAGSTNNRQDAWLIKTDSNGIEEWNSIFGGAAMDEGYSVNQTQDGGYIIAGYTESYGAGSADFWLIKADSNGNEQWNMTFGGTGLEKGYSVQQTSDGGYIVAGYTDSFGAGYTDIWLVKLSAGKPDLVIKEEWVCQQNCSICYNLTNIGNGTAPAGHNTSLYVDGIEKAQDLVSTALEPNASYIGCFNYSWTFTPPEDNITVCADNNNDVAESNESNNCLTNTWTCGDVTPQYGVINLADVATLYSHVARGTPISNEWAGDVTPVHGVINLADVATLYSHVARGTALNCGCA